jgi:hypothetical protein
MLRDRLAGWERLMDGRLLDGINEDEPLDDWGHTVDDVDGPLEWDPEAWDDLIPTAAAGVDEALRLERELRGRFNLADVANLASKLHTTAQLLHRVLLEAYGAAHRTHPGKVTRS